MIQRKLWSRQLWVRKLCAGICLEKKEFDYVRLWDLESDRIESEFSVYRQSTGANVFMVAGEARSSKSSQSAFKCCEADPPENCHLNVKKLSKTYIFFKKIDKNCLFFVCNFLTFKSNFPKVSFTAFKSRLTISKRDSCRYHISWM